MPSEKRKKMKSRVKEEKLCIFMIQGIFSTTGKEGNNCYILNLTSFYTLLSAIFKMHRLRMHVK